MQSTATPVEKLVAFDQWLTAAFRLPTPLTDASIKAHGTLLEESSKPYEAAHAEGKWRVATYRFEGLKIVALVQEAEPRTVFVTTVELTGPRWSLDNGLAVGHSVSKIKMLVASSSNPLQFCGVNNCIEFGATKGQINRITLSLYAE